jgi:hypothetical protein
MPRKRLKPTPEQRRYVKSLAAYGMKPLKIARYLGLSEKTFLKYYAKEVFRGPFEANAKVGQTLLEMATDGNHVAATLFAAKALGGSCENRGGDVRPVVLPNLVVMEDKKAA